MISSGESGTLRGAFAVMVEFTLVAGVDGKHFRQLETVWPTWMKHKPQLRDCPLLIFHDADVTEKQIRALVGPEREDVTVFAWPPPGVVYGGDPTDKWYHPQRYKMLAGFVHVPAMHCHTEYWLKLDTDVVACGMPDWIDSEWFRDEPSILSHRWGYTKPADQMQRLDAWVENHAKRLEYLARHEPLRMAPEPGSDILRHPRIISWCAFFHTGFTKFCSQWASQSIGEYRLPVPSQDGYLWYIAKRLGLRIKTTNMKSRGWQQWNTERNIRQAAEVALEAV